MTLRPARPRYVSVDTAAEMLEVSPRTIRRRIYEGRLPAKKTGKGVKAPVRINEADVYALLLDL